MVPSRLPSSPRKSIAIKTPRAIYKTRPYPSRGKKRGGDDTSGCEVRSARLPDAFEAVRHQAQNYPKFRNLIVGLAQANHRFSTNIQRRLYGQSTDVKIRPLNEEKAVQAAADLLGEFFVFSVAGAAIIYEVQRSAKSEARKEELRRKEIEALKQNENDLAKELGLLRDKLNELERLARGRDLFNKLGVAQSQESQSSKPMPAAS